VLAPLAGWAGATWGITDAEIEARIEAMSRYHEVQSEPYSEDAFGEFLRRLVEDVPVDELTIRQIERIAPLYLYHPDTRTRMIRRLRVLEADPGLGGARAAVMRLILSVRDAPPDRAAEALGQVLSHYGIPRLVEAGLGSDLIGVLRVLPTDALRPHTRAVAAIAEAFPAAMPPQVWASSLEYLEVLERIAILPPPGLARAAQTRLLGQLHLAATRVEAAGDAALATWLRERTPPDTPPPDTPPPAVLHSAK
jgi:hypothetical protein